MTLNTLFVSNSLKFLYRSRKNFLMQAAKQSSRLSICAPLDDTTAAKELETEGIKLLPISMSRVGMNPLTDFLYFLSLRSIIKQENPSTILNFTIKPIIYSSLAARSLKQKNIVIYSMFTGLGFVFSACSLKARFGKIVVKKLLQTALLSNKHIFFLNSDDLLQIKKEGLIPSHVESSLIPGCGVSLQHFRYAPPVEEPITFLFVGRILTDKGVGEFIEAAKHLKRKYPKRTLHFQLLGPLDTNPTAVPKAQLLQWCREGGAEYLGATEDVRPYLQSSSVFVLPSYREGMPRATMEAMALGRPIVTTLAPGCHETVKEGKNGYLVPTKDSQALASAMEKFILDKAKIVNMGLVSRDMAEEIFDEEKINSQIIKHLGL